MSKRASITASAIPVPAVPGKSTVAPAGKGVAGLSQTLNSPHQSGSRYDFFIAYATPDRRQAQELCWYLQDHSCKVFLDVNDISPGASWPLALREALEASHAIVVLVSTHANDAFYQQEEIVRAIQLARDKPSAHTVIPVILEKLPQGAVSMPYGMSSLQAQDATRSGGLKRVATELVAWLKDHQRNTKQPQMADAMIEASKSTGRKKTLQEWVGVPRQEVVLAIVFVDGVGSTLLLNQLGSERMEALVRQPFFTQAQGLCSPYDGFIVKSLGDAILGAFRTPTYGLDFLLACLANHGSDFLAVKAGMDVGQVILQENDLQGQAVHYAAHLVAMAKPNEILMSERAKNDIWAYRAARHDHLLFNPKSDRVRDFEGDHHVLWSVVCPHRHRPLLAAPAAKAASVETSTNGIVHLS